MSDISIGKFQVLGTLGTGAHSSILHIRRNADSKHYALKVVPIDGAEDQKFLEQAQHEYRVAQMLSHPNLLRIYACESTKNWLFRVTKVQLLLEYVNGKTLDTCPRISLPRMAQVFEKVAGAIAHMHRRKVCHADLKPNNILLSRTGDVKVIDFGLAWIKGEDKGRLQGTPEYMAPEQARKKIANELTDMYNFGATMYRMVTWRLPPAVVSEEDDGLPIDQHTFARMFKPVAEYNPQAPKALCKMIQDCMAFDPEKRPKRMADVQTELASLVETLVVSPEDSLETMEW
jgi:serine/threonine protein kinase